MKKPFTKLWLFLLSVVMAFAAIFAAGCDNEKDKDVSTDTIKGEQTGGEQTGGEQTGGETTDTTLTEIHLPDFLAKENGINIRIDPFEFQQTYAQSYAVNGDGTIKKIYTIATMTGSLENFYLYAGINSEGFLYVYGEYSATTIEVREPLTQEAPSKTKTQTLEVGKFLLEKDQLYLWNKTEERVADGEPTETSGVICGTIQELLGDITETIPIMIATIVPNFDKIVEIANTDIRPLVNNLATWYNTTTAEAEKLLLNAIFNVKKLDTGYELTTKDNFFQTLGDDVTQLKTSEFIDKYLGAGTFAVLEKFPNVLDVKVGDVVKALADKGITLDKITSLLDKLVQAFAPAQEEGAAAPTFKDMTGVDLAEIAEEYKDLTLGELYVKITTTTPPSDPSTTEEPDLQEIITALKAILNQVLTNMKEKTIVQLAAQFVPADNWNESIVTAVIKAYALMLDEGITAKITLNTAYTVTGVELTLNKDVVNQLSELTAKEVSDGVTPINDKVTFKTGIKVTVTYGAENQANKTAFNKDKFVADCKAEAEKEQGEQTAA